MTRRGSAAVAAVVQGDPWDGTLFASAVPVTPIDRAKQRERDKERLWPRLESLARRRGPEGFTAADVIAEAILAGVFTGEEWRMHPRAYAWVGPWLVSLAKAGELVPLTIGGHPVLRRSTRERSHGNRNAVYLHPDHAGACR